MSIFLGIKKKQLKYSKLSIKIKQQKRVITSSSLPTILITSFYPHILN